MRRLTVRLLPSPRAVPAWPPGPSSDRPARVEDVAATRHETPAHDRQARALITDDEGTAADDQRESFPTSRLLSHPEDCELSALRPAELFAVVCSLRLMVSPGATAPR